MKYFLILFISSIVLFSCRSQKEVTEKVESEKESEIVEIKDVETGRDVITPIEMTDQEKKDYQLIQAQLTPVVFAQIRRTPCFGRCPTYTLTVYFSGRVEYKGERNVEKIGLYTAEVDKDLLKKLTDRANEINYFQMNNFYDNPNVTDLPTTITSVRKGSKMKTTVNRIGGPTELMAFEKYFDELFSSVEWEVKDEMNDQKGK